MSIIGVSRPARASKFAFILFVVWFAVLLLAGGASRIDVLGQTLVRGTAWFILLACLARLPCPDWRPYAPVGLFICASIALVAIQLIPMPPSLWMSLPGRDIFGEVSNILGDNSIWRPISISPGWTINALGSLVVAVVTFVLGIFLKRRQHQLLLALILGVALVSSVVGLLQFSGANFDHPLVNDVKGDVSGLFANRNHFALLLAIACAIMPVWIFGKDGQIRWRLLAGGSLLVLFFLMILASGSRAGTLLGVLGLALGLLVVRNQAAATLRTLPKRVRLSSVASGIILMGGIIVASFVLGRATSLDRAMEIGVSDNVRLGAYFEVAEMAGQYFPFGTGFGTFDPAYRIAEPSNALSPNYLNQAHNDLLQVVLEGGLLGLILMFVVIGWALVMSWRAWRSEGRRLPRLGSVVLLLIFVASGVDYPARTPLVMALVVLAAIWLADPFRRST